MSKQTTPEAFAAGRQTMESVYGAALLPPEVKAGGSPFQDETVGHLFADIWSRPGLSVRDRRLLVLGATAMLGRADLIEVQTFGALANGELNKAELDEALLQLAFYVGWGNATAVQSGFRAALARHDAKTKADGGA
jgi:alkylhydroperoxidase/carboxymuconolactone decarboxylase family protein YurZ